MIENGMGILHIIGILTSLAAFFAYVNYRFIRLPFTTGLMLQSLAFSICLLGLMSIGFDIGSRIHKLFLGINFNVLFLGGILCFLLFAGGLFVEIEELLEVKVDIALLAVVGVLFSTAVIGSTLLVLSRGTGFALRPVYCFLFGALISPTDPVAVLPVLRKLGISERLNAIIAGESLFNDGIGIVLFLSLLGMAGDPAGGGAGQVALLFTRKALGGVIFGASLGWIGYMMIKSVDNYRLEILITLALVSGGYSLAEVLGVSGPLAMVIAALLIGGRGRKHAMSDKTRENLDQFWDLVEEFLNAVLFTLIGLEVLVVTGSLSLAEMAACLVAIPLVLAARYLTVLVLGIVLRLRGDFSLRTAWIMTWSGLRGGIPIALAISLPVSQERSLLLFATYLVVVFSILIQGTTLQLVVRSRHR